MTQMVQIIFITFSRIMGDSITHAVLLAIASLTNLKGLLVAGHIAYGISAMLYQRIQV